MRNSDTLSSLRFSRQEKIQQGDETEIITYLNSARGYACEHHVRYCLGDEALTFYTTIRNDRPEKLGLEMLSSFSIGGITPFASDDAPNRLHFHRFRSFWSAEGRHICQPNRGTSSGTILVRAWCSNRAIWSGWLDASPWLSSIGGR